jgi:hypothetical protein
MRKATKGASWPEEFRRLQPHQERSIDKVRTCLAVLWRQNEEVLTLWIYSAYEAWKRNNQKNLVGDDYATSLKTFVSEDMVSTNGPGLLDPSNWTKLPGIVRIPVCTLEDVIKNLAWWGDQGTVRDQKKPPCPEYPCCSGEVLYKNLPFPPKGVPFH